MKLLQFIFKRIAFVAVVVIGTLICYHTGKWVLVDLVDVSNMHLIGKFFVAVLGGMFWGGIIIIGSALVHLYEIIFE